MKRKRQTLLGIVVATFVVAGVAVAGTSTSLRAATTNDAASQAAGTVTFRLLGDWFTLDPFDPRSNSCAGAACNQVEMAAYDRLLAIDSSKKVIPYLAKSWVVTPGKVVFTLRTDVVCADGTKLTPQAIANSVGHFFQQSPYAKSQYGAGPFHVGLNRNKMTVDVGGVSTDILLPFTEPQSDIICPAGLAPGADRVHKTYGSGPYTVSSVTPGSQISFQLRKNWKWGPNGTTAQTPGLPKSLVFTAVTNESTAANLLKTGGLDISMVNGDAINQVQGQGGLHDYITVAPMGANLQFNQSAGKVMADLQVRKAVATAVNSKDYSIASSQGRAKVSTSFMSVDMPCYDPATAKLIPKTSISAAQTILKNDGYQLVNGVFQKNGKPLAITVIGSADLHGAGPDYVAAQLQQVGFKVTESTGTHDTWSAAWRSGNWDISPFNINNPLLSPAITIDYLAGTSTDAVNFSHVNNAAANKAIVAARSAANDTARCKAWSTVQHDLLTSYNLEPLDSPEQVWFAKSNVTFVARTAYIDLTTIREK
jgi:peptide/nickel transport system substrate-binding protein